MAVAVKQRATQGRHNVFKPEFVEQAQKMSRLGATEAEIAHLLGVSVMTLWRWRAKNEDFAQAFKLGREAAAERIENSMFHRAVGYTYPSEKIVVVDKKVERVPIKEHVPPDVTAGQFLLTNYKPGEFRNRQSIEAGAPGDFDRMSDDELRRFITAEAATVVGSLPAKLEAPKKASGIAAAPRASRKPSKSDLFG
jgi:hypothetical protein